jgi:hypothetical protein
MKFTKLVSYLLTYYKAVSYIYYIQRKERTTKSRKQKMSLIILGQFNFARNEAGKPEVSAKELLPIEMYESDKIKPVKACAFRIDAGYGENEGKVTAFSISNLAGKTTSEDIVGIVSGAITKKGLEKGETKNGKSFIKFKLKAGNKFYVTCKLFGKTLERFEKMIEATKVKGYTPLAMTVEGKFSSRLYNDIVYYDILANNFEVTCFSGESVEDEETVERDPQAGLKVDDAGFASTPLFEKEPDEAAPF